MFRVLNRLPLVNLRHSLLSNIAEKPKNSENIYVKLTVKGIGVKTFNNSNLSDADSK